MLSIQSTVQNGHEGDADVPFGVSRTVVKNHGTKGDIKNHSSSKIDPSEFGTSVPGRGDT